MDRRRPGHSVRRTCDHASKRRRLAARLYEPSSHFGNCPISGVSGPVRGGPFLPDSGDSIARRERGEDRRASWDERFDEFKPLKRRITLAVLGGAFLPSTVVCSGNLMTE